MGQTQVPGDRGGLRLSLEADGVLSGMHPAHAPETLALVQGLLPTQAHTGLRGTQSNPEFHSHPLAHTQAGRETGLRQRLLCCSCPTMWGGGWTPPGEGPREGDGWEQVPGPVPTPGEGLPGPQTLLVPCRPGSLLPLLHAAPKGQGRRAR